MSREAETAFLVKFLEANRELARNKFTTKFPDRAAHNQAWEDIALQVNSLGLSRYKRKGQEMRKKWADLKNRIKKKHAMIQDRTIGTGGEECLKDALTPMEERVIGMLEITSSSKGINTEEPMDSDSAPASLPSPASGPSLTFPASALLLNPPASGPSLTSPVSGLSLTSPASGLTLTLDEDIDRPIKLEPTEEFVLGTNEVSCPPTPLISSVNTVQAMSSPKILPITTEEAAVNSQELANGGLSSLHATRDKTPRVMAKRRKRLQQPKKRMDQLFELEEKRLKLEEKKLKIKKESLENKKRQTKIMEEQLDVLKKLLEKFD